MPGVRPDASQAVEFFDRARCNSTDPVCLSGTRRSVSVAGTIIGQVTEEFQNELGPSENTMLPGQIEHFTQYRKVSHKTSWKLKLYDLSGQN